MKSVVTFLCAMVLVLACSKDKLTTNPKLKFIKATPADSVKASNVQVLFELEFSDKQGDVGNSPLKVMLFRQNLRRPSGTINDTFNLTLPNFPNSTDGTILVPVNYLQFDKIGNIGGVNYPDSVIVKFLLKDRAGNLSDTAQSGLIIAK